MTLFKSSGFSEVDGYNAAMTRIAEIDVLGLVMLAAAAVLKVMIVGR